MATQIEVRELMTDLFITEYIGDTDRHLTFVVIDPRGEEFKVVVKQMFANCREIENAVYLNIIGMVLPAEDPSPQTANYTNATLKLTMYFVDDDSDDVDVCGEGTLFQQGELDLGDLLKHLPL